jgi:hypothetical protein
VPLHAAVDTIRPTINVATAETQGPRSTPRIFFR